MTHPHARMPISATGHLAQPGLRRRGDPRTRRQAGRPQIIAGLGWPREALAAFGLHLAMNAAHSVEVGLRATRNSAGWRQPLTF